MRKLFSVLFSRYMLSLLIILLEVGFLLYLVIEMSAYSALFLIFILLVNLAVLISIINADCNPEYRVTWMAVVLIVPVLGAVIYILFSRRRMSRREARIADEIIGEIDARRENPTELNELAQVSHLAAGKAMAILSRDRTAEVYCGTSARYYSMGEEMYRDMLSDISLAEKYVFLEYFIIDEGAMWDGIHAALVDCVGRGVEVRLIYDDIGCMKTLPPHFDRVLKEEGIRAVRFAPVTPIVSVAHNNRDHRKICVVDGRVAYTGGINIADEYIGARERFGVWKDGGVRVEGDAARGFVGLFLANYDISLGTVSDYDRYLCSPSESAGRGDGGFYIPFGSGPSPMYSRPVGKRAFLDIINQSERYLYITTPYLIIDFDLTEALCGAAERGVDVRIITPGIPDKPLVKVMTKSSYPYLMRHGVKIYEYTPGFMHHKLLVADDAYAVVGTINMDYRSLVHHYEDALWMYSSPIITEIRNDYMKTLTECHAMTKEEAALGAPEWLIKCALRLFAPLF